jgi:hypothetical protein
MRRTRWVFKKERFPSIRWTSSCFSLPLYLKTISKKIKYDRSARNQVKQIKRVADISIELNNAINHLEEPARLRLRSAYGSLELLLIEIHKMVEAICSVAQAQKKKESHRPLRSFKHSALNFLVEGLYLSIVVEAKGELTLWQDSATGELKGTLPDVLELLRPHLPGLLPEKMNFSTLHRALARAKSQ